MCNRIVWAGLLLTICISCELFPTTTPTPESNVFIKLHGNAAKHNYGQDFIQTSDSGYVLIGRTNTLDNEVDKNAIYIVKTDKNGDEEWSRNFQVPKRDTSINKDTTFQSFGINIQELTNQNLLIIGRATVMNITTFFIARRDYLYLDVIDKNGTFIEGKMDTIINNFYGDFVRSVYATSDDGFVIVTDDNWATNGCEGDNAQVYKFDKEVNLEWRTTVSLNNSIFDECHCSCVDDVLQKNDGSYQILYSNDATPTVVTLNPSGNITGAPFFLADLPNISSNVTNANGNAMAQSADGTIAYLYTSLVDNTYNVYLTGDNKTLTYGASNQIAVGRSIKPFKNAKEENGFIVSGTLDTANRKTFYITNITNKENQWETGSLKGRTIGSSFNWNDIGTIRRTSDGGYAFIGTNDFEDNRMMIFVKLNSQGELDETVE